MAYYAGNNKVSTDPFDGSIPITAAQYAKAIEAITAGKRISIDGGFKILGTAIVGAADPGPPTVDDVVVERDRRLSQGFSYDFKGITGYSTVFPQATSTAIFPSAAFSLTIPVESSLSEQDP